MRTIVRMENHPGFNDALRLSMAALAVAAVFAGPASAGSLINPGEKTFDGDAELTVEGVVAQNRFAGLGAGDGKAHVVSTGGHAVMIAGGGRKCGRCPLYGYHRERGWHKPGSQRLLGRAA